MVLYFVIRIIIYIFTKIILLQITSIEKFKNPKKNINLKKKINVSSPRPQ